MWQTHGEKECVLTRGGLTDVAYAIEYWRLRLKQDLSREVSRGHSTGRAIDRPGRTEL